MRPAVAFLALLALAGCGTNRVDLVLAPGSTSSVTASVTVAVTVDETGDATSRRVSELRREYGDGRSFEVEHMSAASFTTDGGASESTSTVLVMQVAGDVERVVEQLRAEEHVLDVVVRG